jgi:hypothetical protein
VSTEELTSLTIFYYRTSWLDPFLSTFLYTIMDRGNNTQNYSNDSTSSIMEFVLVDNVTNAEELEEESEIDHDDSSISLPEHIVDNDYAYDEDLAAEGQDSFHSIRDELERARLDKLRQQLEALKLQGKISARQRQWELHQAQLKCHMVQTKLREQLMERTHQSMYMRFLTYDYQEYEQKKNGPSNHKSKASSSPVVSTEVLQQETLLLSIMHRAFMVMRNQMEVTQISYRKNLFKFLSREIRLLRKENARASEQVVQELSLAAEENDRLYDEYQQRVEEQERQLRDLRRQLLQRSGKNSKHQQFELLAETEHSETTYSEDDDDDTEPCTSGDDSVSPSPFPRKVTKLLLTPTEKIKSLGKNVQNLRNMADRFQLPF